MSTNETRPHETDGARQAEWTEDITAHGTWRVRHTASGGLVELQPVGPTLDREAVYFDVLYRESPGAPGESLIEHPIGDRSDAQEIAWEKALEVLGDE
jgi:hypothetical protein